MSKPTALITGAGGFIGSHLTARLAQLGWQTVAATGGQAEPVNQDYVFHLAGTASVPGSLADPEADFTTNALLTLQLLEAIRRSGAKPKFVYISSAAIYGDPAKFPIVEDDPPAPVSPYGVSKLAAEQYVRLYADLYAIPSVVLRPFSVYGPGQRKLAVYELLQKLRAPGDTLEVRGDGQQMRDFIHVNDLLDAMMTIAERAAFNGEAYNVASGKATTIKELVATMLEVSGQNRTIVYSNKTLPGEPLRWQVDISKLKALGFAPKIDLKQGLRSLLESEAAPSKPLYVSANG